MSASGRNLPGHEREEMDNYATPAWCTKLILPHLQVGRKVVKVLDPCCGKGAILDVVAPHWPGVTTRGIELNGDRAVQARRAHHVLHGDALVDAWPDADVCVTNPPYSLALEFIEKALLWIADGVHVEQPHREAAFLLRINFLGAEKRAAFHRAHPADIYVLSKRPGFVAALSCKMKRDKVAPCTWAIVMDIDAELPKTCPKCGAGVNVSKSDATEYGWFVWGPGRGNRWWMLETNND